MKIIQLIPSKPLLRIAEIGSQPTRRLAKILMDKGYRYQFVYSKGAGHTQRKVINHTLPQALEYAWQGYSGQQIRPGR